jgi:zinc transport system permease protein
MVPPSELWLIAGLDIIVLAVGLLFYNQFQAVCFDEEFARLRGVKVEFYFLLLLCLTALTVVLLVWVVGIVLVVALLTLPVAIAGIFSKTLWQMMAISALLTVFFTTVGFAVSYAPDLPTGGTIVVLTGAAYLASMFIGGFLKRRRARR